jgi:hypothetical protein
MASAVTVLRLLLLGALADSLGLLIPANVVFAASAPSFATVVVS